MHATDRHESPPYVTAIQNELGRLGELAEALALLAHTPEHARGEKAALCLLKFYAACERILVQIDREVHVRPARRVDWHTRLLQEADADLPGTRPPILSTPHRKLLQKLLAFRNLERSIYGYVPAPYVIAKLSELVLAQQPILVKEFQRFLVFLRQSHTRREERARMWSVRLRRALPEA